MNTSASRLSDKLGPGTAIAAVLTLSYLPYRYFTLPNLLAAAPQEPHWTAFAAALLETVAALATITGFLWMVAKILGFEKASQTPEANKPVEAQ